MIERFKTFTVLIAKINRSIKRIKTEEMDEFNLKALTYRVYIIFTKQNL